MIMPKTAYADVGPKPSIIIDFKGLHGENFYVTLLSEIPSTGPHSALGEHPNNQRYNTYDEDYYIWKKFVDYKDIDGYYFLQYFKNCTETSEFKWGYYPPPKFKILIYFSETDSFLISDESFERYAFNSYFTATVNQSSFQISNNDEMTFSVKKSYNYTNEIISFFSRVIATIVIEIFIALLFDLRKKKILVFITIVNIITQIILNILLSLTNYNYGSMLFVFNYIWMELLVFIIEAFAYSIWFNKLNPNYKIKKWVAPVYSFIANAASFVIGMCIAYLLPGIF